MKVNGRCDGEMGSTDDGDDCADRPRRRDGVVAVAVKAGGGGSPALGHCSALIGEIRYQCSVGAMPSQARYRP